MRCRHLFFIFAACMKKAVIGMGSNMGDRAENLTQARKLMSERVGVITRCSSVAETESWGFDAPPFLNQAVILQTELPPLALLDELQQIERELGRTQKTQIVDGAPVYQSRTIDLDILDYDGMCYQDSRLTIPHPHIGDRNFVINELVELGLQELIPTSCLETSKKQPRKMIPYNYIVVEGCIGAGKTTLSKMLAADYNAEIVLERFADNPFLPKFYKDPVHYAFPVEMTFLMDRYQQLKSLLSARDLFTDCVIGDYFIDKCIIFSKNNLLTDEYNLYKNVFDTISSFLPKPDMIMYLYNDTDHLLKNIAKRGREYEKEITADYLQNIQDSYLTYFRQHATMPILLVDTSQLDFVQSKDDYERLRQLVEQTYPAGIQRITF